MIILDSRSKLLFQQQVINNDHFLRFFVMAAILHFI